MSVNMNRKRIMIWRLHSTKLIPVVANQYKIQCFHSISFGLVQFVWFHSIQNTMFSFDLIWCIIQRIVLLHSTSFDWDQIPSTHIELKNCWYHWIKPHQLLWVLRQMCQSVTTWVCSKTCSVRAHLEVDLCAAAAFCPHGQQYSLSTDSTNLPSFRPLFGLISLLMCQWGWTWVRKGGKWNGPW